MKTYTHETQVSSQRPNESDQGYARRIADTLHDAAPDLLEALRYLDDAINEPSLKIDLVAASNRARAALAKAEGRA